MHPITFFRYVRPFYLHRLDSRYLFFVESLHFCCFFLPCSRKGEWRTRVVDFLRASRLLFLSFYISSLCLSRFYLVYLSLSLSLLASGSLFIFLPPLPSPLPLLSRLLSRCLLCQRLLSAASTAGLWYTGSMVSRYTPATAAPSSRPLGEPVRFPRCLSRRALPPPLARRRSRYRVVLSPFPLSGEPCFAAPLVPPLRFCSRGPRDVSTIGLLECRSFFMGLLCKPRYLETTATLHLQRLGRHIFEGDVEDDMSISIS